MPKLFVVSPFGSRIAPQSPVGVIDFDLVYQEGVRPAAERAGWEVIRIDEINATGNISDHYLREILSADLVLGDISVENPNVFYELGIRQAISTGGTLLIAQQASTIPFDLSAQRIIFYEHTAPGLRNLKNRLYSALLEYRPGPGTNPIRAFLEKVGAVSDPERDPLSFEREVDARIERCRTVDQLIAVWHWVKNISPAPARALLTLAERLAEFDEWSISAKILRKAADERPDDFEVHRQLGWYLQQSGGDDDAESLAAFERALALNPSDPETLGMLGGRYKRRGEYPRAREYYERAVGLSPNSIYILVNLAAVEILSNTNEPQAGVERYGALVERLRPEVLTSPDEWAELVLGEALFASGEQTAAWEHYSRAVQLGATRKSVMSAARQLALFAERGFRANEAKELAGLLNNVPPRVETNELGPEPPADGGTAAVPPILVHISDVHFGSVERDGKRKGMHRFWDGENTQRLSSHIIEEIKARESRNPGEISRIHLIVSGDLAYTGTENEFGQAHACLEEICSGLRLSKERVHIIPGNHDIYWLASRADMRSRFDNYLTFLLGFYGEDLFRKRFPGVTWPITITKRPEAYELVSVAYDSTARLLVVGMNSCVYETEQHHYGFVGQRQLKLIRELVAKMEVPDSCVRVALIHHHLHPFPEQLDHHPEPELWMDLSTVRDAGHVERYLEKMGFDLVLHGHKHKPQLRETLVREVAPQQIESRPLIVCGAGTISCNELEHSEPNQYQVLELRQIPRRAGVEFVRVEWRTMPLKTGAEWSTTATWSILG